MTGKGSGSSDDGVSKVGYKSPPIQSRFRKGQSGNPRGAPKHVLDFRKDIKRSLELLVEVNANGMDERVNSQLAALLRLREMALKGNMRALTKYLGLAEEVDGVSNVAPGDYDLTLLTDEELELVANILEKAVRVKVK